MNKWKFLVWLTFFLHLSLSLFLVLGWMWESTYWLNLFCVIIFPIIWYIHGSCILWDLEKYFQRKVNPNFNAKRTFIAHYSYKLLGHSYHENFIHKVQVGIHLALIFGHGLYLYNLFY